MAWKPELITGNSGILRTGTEFQRKEALQFETKESKIFSEAEVNEILKETLAKDGAGFNDLEVIGKEFSPDKKLTKVLVRLTPAKAAGRGWQGIEYSYRLKGDYGRFKHNTRTMIARHSYNYDLDGEPRISEVIAEYKNGKWEYYEVPQDIHLERGFAYRDFPPKL
jgi:hypothetical protein